jgi:protein-S-isoprenylcysteine O-methyltransferase Ste14
VYHGSIQEALYVSHNIRYNVDLGWAFLLCFATLDSGCGSPLVRSRNECIPFYWVGSYHPGNSYDDWVYVGFGFLIYLVVFFLLLHLLVVFVEEPMLKQKFGELYEQYCKSVPRWIPRLRPFRGDISKFC